MNITFTDNAIKRFKQNLEKKPDAVGLRISIKATGCNGYAYIWLDTHNVPLFFSGI